MPNPRGGRLAEAGRRWRKALTVVRTLLRWLAPVRVLPLSASYVAIDMNDGNKPDAEAATHIRYETPGADVRIDILGAAAHSFNFKSLKPSLGGERYLAGRARSTMCSSSGQAFQLRSPPGKMKFPSSQDFTVHWLGDKPHLKEGGMSRLTGGPWPRNQYWRVGSPWQRSRVAQWPRERSGWEDAGWRSLSSQLGIDERH